MKLNPLMFDKIRKDLEKKKAEVRLIAYMEKEGIDYTILATFPNGETWEIIDIREEL